MKNAEEIVKLIRRLGDVGEIAEDEELRIEVEAHLTDRQQTDLRRLLQRLWGRIEEMSASEAAEEASFAYFDRFIAGDR